MKKVQNNKRKLFESSFSLMHAIFRIIFHYASLIDQFLELDFAFSHCLVRLIQYYSNTSKALTDLSSKQPLKFITTCFNTFIIFIDFPGIPINYHTITCTFKCIQETKYIQQINVVGFNSILAIRKQHKNMLFTWNDKKKTTFSKDFIS